MLERRKETDKSLRRMRGGLGSSLLELVLTTSCNLVLTVNMAVWELTVTPVDTKLDIV